MANDVKKYSLYLIAIVGIVAIVGIWTMVSGTGKLLTTGTSGESALVSDESSGEGDLAGQAFLNVNDNKYITPIKNCKVIPSCASPNYEVTSTNCNSLIGDKKSAKSCYTCSVKEEFKSKAVCPEGWKVDFYNKGEYYNTGGSEWLAHGFACSGACTKKLCQTPPTLSNACPKEFTFFYKPQYTNKYMYFCLMPNEPQSTDLDGICNQCDSIPKQVSFADGDIICVTKKQ
ncbi:hypothetical protein HY636_04440 [Candidatus Woesearchaeota archaeon]|nr:hypothetical protein [Candidatus Woesearchaeota archaeon]